MSERIRRPELVKEAVERFQEHGVEAWREELGTLELALDQIEDQVKAVNQAVDDRFYTTEQAKARIAKYETKGAMLEAEAEALRQQIAKGEEHTARVRATEALLRRLKDPDRMSFEQRRRVLDTLGVEVVLPAEGAEKAAITWLGATLAEGALDL